MGVFELANKLAILQVGRNPGWEDIVAAGFASRPTSATDGIFLQDSPKTLVLVDLREDVQRRTCRVTMGVLDVAATYTVTINGTAINYATPSDEDDLIIGLHTAVQADATVGRAAATPIIDSQPIDAAGDVTTGTVAGGNAAVELKIFGEAVADYTVDISATLTGTLLCGADPSGGQLSLYALMKGTGANAVTGWRRPNAASYAVTDAGFVERFETGGVSRFAAVLDGLATAGDGASVTYTAAPTVKIGYAREET